jgi:hypothetical protein
MTFEFLVRSAYELSIVMPPNPSRLAKPRHRRSPGSSCAEQVRRELQYRHGQPDERAKEFGGVLP